MSIVRSLIARLNAITNAPTYERAATLARAFTIEDQHRANLYAAELARWRA